MQAEPPFRLLQGYLFMAVEKLHLSAPGMVPECAAPLSIQQGRLGLWGCTTPTGIH